MSVFKGEHLHQVLAKLLPDDPQLRARVIAKPRNFKVHTSHFAADDLERRKGHMSPKPGALPVPISHAERWVDTLSDAAQSNPAVPGGTKRRRRIETQEAQANAHRSNPAGSAQEQEIQLSQPILKARRGLPGSTRTPKSKSRTPATPAQPPQPPAPQPTPTSSDPEVKKEPEAPPTDSAEAAKCAACMDRIADRIFVPCGHLAMCNRCCVQHNRSKPSSEAQGQCPLCKTALTLRIPKPDELGSRCQWGGCLRPRDLVCNPEDPDCQHLSRFCHLCHEAAETMVGPGSIKCQHCKEQFDVDVMVTSTIKVFLSP